MYKILRLKFLPGQQKLFLDKLESMSGFNSDKLGSIVGVTGRTYREWKCGRSCIPKEVAEKFCMQFGIQLPIPLEEATQNWVKWKSLISSKGGIVRYKKHGLGTYEGRSKGGYVSLQRMREKGMIPKAKIFNYPYKSKQLAEFVGIMLGDGSITHGHTEVVLNKIADSKYISYVKSLYTDLFGEEPKTYSKDKFVRVYLDGINLVSYLRTIGLNPGNKVKMQVEVPEWITKNKYFRRSCARGLMDTDGCTFLHKYKVNNTQYQYQKAAFASNSKPLIDFVFSVFTEIGLHPKITRFATNRVWLYNSQEVKKYLRVIGSSNPRLYIHEEA